MDKRAKMTQPNPSPNSSRNRMRDMFQKLEVPDEGVPVIECFDCHAKITSKELAPIHSVNSGTVQNACFQQDQELMQIG